MRSKCGPLGASRPTPAHPGFRCNQHHEGAVARYGVNRRRIALISADRHVEDRLEEPLLLFGIVDPDRAVVGLDCLQRAVQGISALKMSTINGGHLSTNSMARQSMQTGRLLYGVD